MVTKKKRVYSRIAKEAMSLLADQIRAARKGAKLSESELSERAGISRKTLYKIERGEPTVALGLVFEVAALVGIALFNKQQESLKSHTRQKLALLPKRIRKSKNQELDDGF